MANSIVNFLKRKLSKVVMTLCNLLKDAHRSGKEEVKQYGERLWKQVDRHPELHGLYLYSGTNIPLAYAQGFCESIFDKIKNYNAKSE